MRPSGLFTCALALALTLLFAAYPATAQPTITLITPPSAKPGDKVTITGANFGATNTVRFGSASATVIQPVAAGGASIDVIVPDVPARSADVVVSAGGSDSAKFPFSVNVPMIPITVTPRVIQPANGKLPTSMTLAVFERDCDDKNGTDLTQGASAPYSLEITGSGLTPSATSNATKCTITSVVTIDPNAAGSYTVILNDKAKNPVGVTDIAVLDSSAGPIPPGLNPQVDVMWEVMSQKNCSDAFGKRVAVSLYCIQVKIGNNSGHALQVAGIGFLKKNIDLLAELGIDSIDIANSSYGSTRAVLVHEQPISLRNLTYNALQGAGLIMSASAPFFGKSTTSHYMTFTSIANGPLLAAYNLLFPDPILKQLNNLDDQSFRDNMVIPNNSQIQTIVFVEKEVLMQTLEDMKFHVIKKLAPRHADSNLNNDTSQNRDGSQNNGASKKQDPCDHDEECKDIERNFQDTINNSKRRFRNQIPFSLGPQHSPLLVKLALGNLVIVGDEIEYLQRVQIQSNTAAPPASSPLTASPANLSFSSQNGVTNGAARAITLTNTGTTPLTNVAATIVGKDFDIPPNAPNACSTTLAAGSQCTVSVEYNPSTTAGAASPRTATLQVSFSPGSTPLSIPLTGVASDTVYFSTMALDLGTAKVTPEMAAPAAAAKTTPAKTAPAPAKATPAKGAPTAAKAAPSKATPGPAETASAAPAAPATPNTAKLTITNFSSNSAAMTALKFDPPLASPQEFTTTSKDDTCSGKTLASNASCTVTITFTPVAVGPRAATTTVTYEIGGVDQSPQPIRLSGTGQK